MGRRCVALPRGRAHHRLIGFLRDRCKSPTRHAQRTAHQKPEHGSRVQELADDEMIGHCKVVRGQRCDDRASWDRLRNNRQRGQHLERYAHDQGQGRNPIERRRVVRCSANDDDVTVTGSATASPVSVFNTSTVVANRGVAQRNARTARRCPVSMVSRCRHPRGFRQCRRAPAAASE